MTIHGAADEAVHEHSRETVTATFPVPPFAANDRGVASKLGWHRDSVLVGLVILVLVELPHAPAAAQAASVTAAVPAEKRLWLEAQRTSSV